MKCRIFLDTRTANLRKNGYPIVASVSLSGKRKFISLKKYSFLEDWNLKTELPKTDKRLSILIQKKRLLLEELEYSSFDGKQITFDDIKDLLFGNANIQMVDFYLFYNQFLGGLKENNKLASYDIYTTALNQLKKFRAVLLFSDLSYSLLTEFKNWQLELGNSKNTIHTYLRKYRAVYNEAVRKKVITDTKPFSGVFKGVTVKSNRTKKRNISKGSIVLLETAKFLTKAQQRSVDFWLLMFYFGGQDLKDVYFLKNKYVAKDRVFFVRGKLDDGGYQFDLKITPAARKIIKKYNVPGEYLFGWRKDYKGYKTFYNNLRQDLIDVQKKLEIEVLPLGGNLSVKVARHTFGTLGKRLFIDPDLLRELMGHERDDVDTIYKDTHPQEVRDEAHLKIIG
ncbi:integrase-like protein [Lutibacter sp. Hel_I_33_5]|uniref:site-specific integrase n=1 Tax=Lutibacter sp. Hel_I_33_5 TaxID=1566289 RepID=UPI0011A61948|nr:site-specific integrase [Lutibacter sp. Hel_I_33_5]TVZ55636.1 integrase-like protein [Lutibacter sp. Hel_I_33_5]